MSVHPLLPSMINRTSVIFLPHACATIILPFFKYLRETQQQEEKISFSCREPHNDPLRIIALYLSALRTESNGKIKCAKNSIIMCLEPFLYFFTDSTEL